MTAQFNTIHVPVRKIAPWMLVLFAAVFAFNFYMNIHASSGIPFWDDDWDYFFGNSLGLRVPLTWDSLFAKENDFVAPVAWFFSHAVGQLVGANLLAFRFLTWIVFGVVLAIYLRLLLRIAPELGVITIAVGLILLSTVNTESFYYQHLALFQPLFFLIFFGYLSFALKENLAAEVVLFFIVATFGILGTGYVVGTIGYALALTVAGSCHRGIDAFRNTRLWATIFVGVAVTTAIAYVTFAGSYVNHTGQGLVLPWHRDFWFFIFGTFSSALGFASDLPSRYVLALGFLAFVFYAGPITLILARSSKESSPADFVLGSFLAGTIVLTMMTAVGRGHFCGPNLADIIACGASPRYVFPVILALPAAIVALARSVPRASSLRPISVGAVLLLLAGGYLFDRNLHPSLARWDFSGMRHMMMTRDAAARTCLGEYLDVSAAPRAGSAPDWRAPLICPTISRGINLAPFVQTAYETEAAFLKPIMAGLDRAQDQPSLKSLLSTEVAIGDSATRLSGLQSTPKDITGNIDRVYDLKDGSQAVIGWAADLDQHTPISHVVVVVDGHVVAVGFTGIERPDIAAALGDARLTDSGFAVPLGTEAGDGKNVSVFAVTRTGKFAELNGDDLNPLDANALPARGDPGTLPDAHCHLDMVKMVGTAGLPATAGKALLARGWTVISGREGIAPDSVVLSLRSDSGKDSLARTHKETRPDVSAHFNQPTVVDAGFATTVNLKGLGGSYLLDVIQIYDGHAYACGLAQSIVVD